MTAEPAANTAHYTHPEMARYIAETGIRPLLAQGLRPSQIRVFDPSCGDGALLRAAFDVLLEESRARGFWEPRLAQEYEDDTFLLTDLVEGQIAGIELDPVAAEGGAEGPDGVRFDVRCTDALKFDYAETRAHECWPWLEAPNCILMNPPYLGGGKISGSLGSEYLKFLKAEFNGGGAADLAAYFLRIASRMCVGGTPETICFVATNTIAQGDTRRVGMLPLVDYDNWDVQGATASIPWPGRAKVSVRIVLLSRGLPRAHEYNSLDSRLLKVPELRYPA